MKTALKIFASLLLLINGAGAIYGSTGWLLRMNGRCGLICLGMKQFELFP